MAEASRLWLRLPVIKYCLSTGFCLLRPYQSGGFAEGCARCPSVLILRSGVVHGEAGKPERGKFLALGKYAFRYHLKASARPVLLPKKKEKAGFA